MPRSFGEPVCGGLSPYPTIFLICLIGVYSIREAHPTERRNGVGEPRLLYHPDILLAGTDAVYPE